MVVYKDVALNLKVINEALIKDYADEKEFENIVPHLMQTGTNVIIALYEITTIIQKSGPIERWKIISLELEIGRYISRISETHLIDNEATDSEDGFISMLRSVYTMCTRYVEMLMEFDGKLMLDDGSIVEYSKGQSIEETQEIVLPQELSTENVKRYFTKAIQVGYIKRNGNYYEWTFGGNRRQVRLGYFCSKVFTNPRPIDALETLFKVKKLSSSITQSTNEALRADVKAWKNEIDSTIFND